MAELSVKMLASDSVLCRGSVAFDTGRFVIDLIAKVEFNAQVPVVARKDRQSQVCRSMLCCRRSLPWWCRRPRTQAQD